MALETPKPPTGLRKSGRALWRAVTADFELSEHETMLLREACRTLDGIDRLQAVLDADGPMSESSQGLRAHPALVELRQQRIALARLFAALRVPTGEESSTTDDGRTQHRGTRGVYAINGGAS